MADLPMQYETSYHWEGEAAHGVMSIAGREGLPVGTPHDIERLIARRGAVVTVVGLALGILMSLGMMRVFDSIFEGFIGFDVLSLTAASFTLLLAALGASYLPARRAAQLDPVVALRTE